MIDTHCHLNFKAFAEDVHAVANAMANNRVAGIVVGCDTTTSRYAIDLSETFPNLWAAVGLHPTHVFNDPWDGPTMKELALLDRVVAIGEVGLDFYRLPDDPARQTEYIASQYATFRSAIRLAKDLKKPLIIHSREAYEEIIEVLTAEFTVADNLLGTVHCFMGNWSQASRLLNLGFMIGFTGVITYADTNPDLLEAVAKVPLGRLLIETDAPYLTPEPYRSEGKKNSGQIPRNLPQYALEVAKTIATVRKLKYMDVVQATEENAKRLFNIIPSYEAP